MSLVTAAPEAIVATASDLASIGWTISAANAATAAPTTGMVAAATDEVSMAIAGLFRSHAQGYQTIATEAATFHDQFVWALNAGAGLYTSTDGANALPLHTVEHHMLNAINPPTHMLARPDSAGPASGGAVVNPLTTWLDVATATVTNLSSLAQYIFSSPAPILQQIIANQIGYVTALATAAQGFGTATVQQLSLLPAVLQTALGDLISGGVVDAIGALWGYVAGFPANVAAASMEALRPALSIPSDIATHLGNVASVNTLQELGLDLGNAVLYPPNATLAAVATTAQDIITAAGDKDFVAILGDVINVPGSVTGAFLNGFPDPGWSTATGIDPAGALLTNPTTGPDFGSIYNILLARETVAHALGAP